MYIGEWTVLGADGPHLGQYQGQPLEHATTTSKDIIACRELCMSAAHAGQELLLGHVHWYQLRWSLKS